MIDKDALLETLERRHTLIGRLANSDRLDAADRRALRHKAEGVQEAMTDVAAAPDAAPVAAHSEGDAVRRERAACARLVANLPQPEDDDPALEAGYACALDDAARAIQARSGSTAIDPEMDETLGSVLREIDNAIAYCEGVQTPAILGASKSAYDGAQSTKRALIDAQDKLLEAMEARGLGVSGPQTDAEPDTADAAAS